MPTLRDIQPQRHDFLKFKGLPWFSEATNQKGLAVGGIYLLSGPPGGGKTTLALQMAVDLAAQGHRLVYLALEQTPAVLKEIVSGRIFPHRRRQLSSATISGKSPKAVLKAAEKAVDAHDEEERIESFLNVDSGVAGMESLPDFLTRQVLGNNVPYANTDVIVVDSIQGLGTAPTSSKPYQRLFEFNRWAKEHGITVVLIGHVTKGGAIAGPRSLEHNVDCVLYMRKAMRFRPLFVPKNRFGPERHDPMSLIMDEWGCLDKSKHVRSRASKAFGFLPGTTDFIEVQALVKLPKYGDRPGIKAPYLPRQKLSQLVGVISSMRDIDISDLTFEISCVIPDGKPYYHTLDLPLAMSMLSSYFQQDIRPGSLFVGEVDLAQEIRPLPLDRYDEMVARLTPDESSERITLIKELFVSAQAAGHVKDLVSSKGISEVRVVGVENLEHLVGEMWPDAKQGGRG